MSSNKTVPMESVASVALAAERQKTGGGLEFPRYFTREGSNPFNDVEWELRTASITNEKGGGSLSAGRGRDSEELVPNGGEHRGFEVFSRTARHSRQGK